MNIGVIGTGDIGAVIVKKFKMANSKGPDSLRKLAAETGAKPVSVEEVVQDVDVLFTKRNTSPWRYRFQHT
jgi:8-hydroxy-5-deazaflavin:NADPH oxidoreductase